MRRKPALLGGLGLALLLASCTNDKLINTLPPGARVDTFNQVTVGKVDILWVIDNSPSTGDKQANLARNFHSFFDYLEQAKVDYHIGVTTTDVSSDVPGSKGRLFGSPAVITAATPDPVAAFEKNVQVGVDGSSNEAGLDGAREALLLNPAGFLRKDAYLFLIFVSDEDDHSAPGTAKYFYRFFEGQKGKGNEAMVSAGAIVGDVPNGCYAPDGGKATPGTRYQEVVDLVGGRVGSVCSTEFSDVLQQMGVDAVGLKRKFMLSLTPDLSTVQVTVKYPCATPAAQLDPTCTDKQDDCGGATGSLSCTVPPEATGSPNGWTYEASSNSLVFHGQSLPPKGAEIDVLYYEPGKKP